MIKLLKHPWIFLLASVVLTVIVKIPDLGLPYFFDETFSYYPAILEMAKVGPNMLPGTIPLILAKGHPLFFYFTASLWLKFVTSDSIVMMRIFPMFIALLALFVFHRFARRHTSIVLANVGVLLLSLQSLFLAQASLVLPEIFLFILVMLCFDSYLSGNFGWYALFGSLMMLTKETGIVFILAFGMAYLFENFNERRTKVFWRKLLFMVIPLFVYLLFLFLHFRKFGVFFFSEHLHLISFEATKVLYKLQSATWTIFLAHGRNLLFFAAIAALGIQLFRKQEIRYRRLLILSFWLLTVFLLFTILNFYVYRYVFPVLGIMLLSSLALIQQIRVRYQALNIAFVIAILSFSGYHAATKRGQSDADLGYSQFLVVHQEMVKYCEQQGWNDQEIGAGFNMVMSLRDRFARYLSTDKNFKTHHLPGIENRDIIIYDSTCWPYEMPENEKNRLTLIKRFQYKEHWGEIYRTNNAKVPESQPQKSMVKL